MLFTRRELCKAAVAALPAAGLMARTDSKFGGVQIGIIVSPTNFRDIPLPADQLLKVLVDAGISGIELQDVRAESYAGAPNGVTGAYPQIGGLGNRARPGVREPLTPEQQEARRKAAEELKSWRLSVSIDKFKSLRKLYNQAGVKIYAFRLASLPATISDDELRYFFDVAQALGSNQITVELPTNADLTQRVGAYGARRKIRLGYHNHTQVNFNSWDTALAQSSYNGINFDVGHFAAAVSQSPVPFIEQHHERITSLHLKDRKFGSNGGRNTPWGQGDTPLKEILQLVKRKKYKFPASIELEYPIPEGSSTVAEIRKCLQFCKDALA